MELADKLEEILPKFYFQRMIMQHRLYHNRNLSADQINKLDDVVVNGFLTEHAMIGFVAYSLIEGGPIISSIASKCTITNYAAVSFNHSF